MRVGVIGGLERAESHYERVAACSGHEAVFHDGEIGGRGAKALQNLIDRCDFVVVVTDVNSHGAVQMTRRRLRARGSSMLLVRRCGLARFATLLQRLGCQAGQNRALVPPPAGRPLGPQAGRHASGRCHPAGAKPLD